MLLACFAGARLFELASTAPGQRLTSFFVPRFGVSSETNKEKASSRPSTCLPLSLCVCQNMRSRHALCPPSHLLSRLPVPLAFVHDFFSSSQVSKAVLGDKKPLTTRPSAALPPADFAAVKANLQEGKCGQVLGEVTDELVVSSLLYPKVRASLCCLFMVPSHLANGLFRGTQSTPPHRAGALW